MSVEEELVAALKRMVEAYELLIECCNIGASFISGECAKEMNEAPGQAYKALERVK